MDKIKEQTEELAAQLKALESVPDGDDKQYIKELEKFNWDLKKADFSPEAQAASKKLTIAGQLPHAKAVGLASLSRLAI